MTDSVRTQYERWIYPQPVDDLEVWVAGGGFSVGDARVCGDIFWPATGYRDGMNILVAGCGANQAARYALQHQTARVTGIDLSEASLAHEERLKAKHGLDNLSLRRMRLEDASGLNETFDFIACSGVLHHLPDPAAGLAALEGVLDIDGVIFVMLYGRYGRAPVYMMQELFRILGATDQSDADVALVKATLPLLSQEHPLRTYAKRSTDMKFDAGLVDLFLHKQDRPYSVGEIMKLTADASLVFQAWVEPMYYNPDGRVTENHPLYHRLEQLSDEDRWKAVELLDGLRSRHDFCVCRPDRPPRSYRIDFREPDFPDRAVPLPPESMLTPASDGKPALLKGPRATPLTLSPPLVALYRQIDGQRTVRKCLEAAPVDAPAEVLKQHGLRFFRSLWRTGHLDFRLKGST
ncbi:MAG: class I SAM-dependent methyltransferase [Alphaproteobacteria bacterium]|nr:class I SAM-dependent methyltransferase [Alphaproteobacteria bacterium]